MLAADRDIFELPAETRLRDHGPDRIELWIRRAKPIVAISIKEAKKYQNHFPLHRKLFLETP
jgi:hypothetical protein